MDEVVVITGATAGVGRAATRAFAAQGASLALLARHEGRLEATKAEAEAAGAAKVLAIPTDVADAGAVEAAATRAERELGPIDVWVNNAMTTVFSPFLDIAPEEYERVTDVTYHGFVNGTRAALARMKPRDRGTIIQVGSALAYQGIPLQSAYCGAKHAIQGFTETVRAELVHDRSAVRISSVGLPGLNTPQFRWCRTHLPRRARPVPPTFQPEVAARAITFAARHPRREILVTWPTVKTVAGARLARWVMPHIVARKAYDAQMGPEEQPADAPDNLFAPVGGDPGAHGPFDEQAKCSSLHLGLSLHRRLVGAGLTALAAGTGAVAVLGGGDRGRRRRRRKWR